MTSPRVVAVTGATAGVGLGIARAFAAAGSRVVGCARHAERGQAVEDQQRAEGLDITFVAGDVRTAAGCEAFVEAVVARHGRLDVLVNNAGTVGPDPLGDLAATDERAFDEIVDTNLKGPFFTTRAAVRANVGLTSVVNIGSVAGEMVRSDLTAYRASKAGAMFLSQCLAETLQPAGVAVHTVVVYRVASDGGRRSVEARIAGGDLDASAAEALRAQYDDTAVDPDDFGAGIVRLVDQPGVLIGPGFVVRP